jgi:hypothetical protein
MNNKDFNKIINKWTQKCDPDVHGKKYCDNMDKMGGNTGPGLYAKALRNTLGLPEYCSPDKCTWIPVKKCNKDNTVCKYIWANADKEKQSKLKNINQICVRNEMVKHDSPIKHIDFVYSKADIKINPEQACLLNKASQSIIIDQLKGQVTARCGQLTKNHVTLGVAQRVSKNDAKFTSANIKEKYETRIKTNKTIKKFPKM